MPLFKSLNVSKKHFCFTFNLYLPISQTHVKPNWKLKENLSENIMPSSPKINAKDTMHCIGKRN